MTEGEKVKTQLANPSISTAHEIYHLSRKGDVDKIITYTQGRIRELTESSSVPAGVNLMRDRVTGFIPSETACYIDEASRLGFKLNDLILYTRFVWRLSDMWHLPDDRSRASFAVVNWVQFGVNSYLGNPHTVTNFGYQEFYESERQQGRIPVSIRALSEKPIGFCGERTAVAQNLFAFLGIQTSIDTGLQGEFKTDSLNETSEKPTIKDLVKDADPTPHAWIFLRIDDKPTLFDVADSKFRVRLQGNPSLYSLSEEQYKRYEMGKTIALTANSLLKNQYESSSRREINRVVIYKRRS